MSLLSVEQVEALAFVSACNQNHYKPTAAQVELWQANREPSAAVYKRIRKVSGDDDADVLHGRQTANSRMFAAMTSDMMRPFYESVASMRESVMASMAMGLPDLRDRTERELVTEQETVVEHLIRLTWLAEAPVPSTDAPGLQLTDLGQALLRHAQASDDGMGDVRVVVLGRDDPLGYPTLVGILAGAGAGLLVDPYLKLGDLHTIVVNTQLSRLLVLGKSNNLGEIASMQTYLQGSLPRQIEVRSSKELHDRILVAEDGGVFTVGASLNGIGRNMTVVSPMPSPARESLKAEYERLWSEAVLVGPRSPEATTDGSGESSGEADESEGSAV